MRGIAFSAVIPLHMDVEHWSIVAAFGSAAERGSFDRSDSEVGVIFKTVPLSFTDSTAVLVIALEALEDPLLLLRAKVEVLEESFAAVAIELGRTLEGVARRFLVIDMAATRADASLIAWSDGQSYVGSVDPTNFRLSLANRETHLLSVFIDVCIGDLASAENDISRSQLSRQNPFAIIQISAHALPSFRCNFVQLDACDLRPDVVPRSARVEPFGSALADHCMHSRRHPTERSLFSSFYRRRTVCTFGSQLHYRPVVKPSLSASCIEPLQPASARVEDSAVDGLCQAFALQLPLARDSYPVLAFVPFQFCSISYRAIASRSALRRRA